jgi:hypothetical protein
MIDFIICDNIKKHRENICEIVDNVMMTVDNEYRKHIFSGSLSSSVGDVQN